MSVHFDDLDINRDIRLDLPLREMSGTIRTNSVAPPHPLVTLVSSPAWTTLDSYLGVLTLDGVADYLTSLAAETATMDFTSGDYSIGGWWFLQSGDPSQELINRFVLNANGWELYHYSNLIMTLRHSHSLTIPPGGANPRSACYSIGWAYNTWHFLLVTRAGATGQFYRGTPPGDFTALATIGDALIDPESCNANLNIGANTGPVSNRHKGMFWRPRVWARALTEADGRWIYERELRWFLS